MNDDVLLFFLWWTIVVLTFWIIWLFIKILSWKPLPPTLEKPAKKGRHRAPRS